MKNKLSGTTRPATLLCRIQPIAVWLLAAVLIGLGGCRKDVMNDIDSIEPTPTMVNLTVDKAKNWWDTNGPLDFRTDGDSIYPLWDLAFQTQFRGDENIVMIPFEWGDTVDFEGRGRIMLALYHHTPSGQIHAKWFGYYASEEDYPRPMSQFNVNDFTGYFFEVNKYGYLSNIIRINNGVIDGYSRGGYATDSLRTSETVEFRCDEEEEEDAGYNASSHMESGTSWCCWWPLRWLCCPERCPTAGGASDISRDARRRFGNGRTGGGSGSDSGTETYNYDRTYPYIGRFWNFGPGINLSDIVTGPGLNNGGGLNQYFNNQIFQMTPDQMRLLEGFRQRTNSSVPMQLLLLVVDPNCLAGPEMWDVPEGGNPEEGFDRCVYDSMLDWLDARAELTASQRYELQSDFGKLERLVILAAGLQLKQYEIQYLLANPSFAVTLQNFVNAENNTNEAKAAASIFLTMKQGNMLNAPTGAGMIFTQKFALFQMGDRNQVSAEAWYFIFAANRNYMQEEYGLTGDPAWLKAIKEAISAGWELIETLGPQLEQLMENFRESMPSTPEEWEVFAGLIWDIFIEVAPEFLPGVSEALAFKNGIIALQDGDYVDGGIEFMSGLLGVLPVGKLLKNTAKAANVVKDTVKAFKLFKNIAKFFKKIFSKLKSLMNNGWKLRYTNNKLIIKDNVGAEAATIEDDLLTLKKTNAFDLIEVGDFKNMQSVNLNPSSSNSLASQVNDTNHIKFKTDEPNTKGIVDDIVANGDLQGTKTENLSKALYEQDGYDHHYGRYGNGNSNGFDNVFVKGPLSNPTEVVINEAKQWPPTLSGPNNQTGLPPQMTDDWVDYVVERIQGTNPELAHAISTAKENGKLVKVVTSVKKTGAEAGQIVTIKVK